VTRIFSLGLVVGISLFAATAAEAMPLAALGQDQPGLVAPVAGGCGPGWHRNAYGVCRPNVAPGVVVAPGAVVVGLDRAGDAAPTAFAMPIGAGGFAIKQKR
jgi:hypothetical protein